MWKVTSAPSAGKVSVCQQRYRFITEFTLHVVLSADNLCKQLRPRSGPTKYWSWSGSKLFATLIVILKKSFEIFFIFHWYFTLPISGYDPIHTDNQSFSRGQGQSRAQLNVKSNKCPECRKSFCSPAGLQIIFTFTQVLCTDNLCKQFRPRSGPTFCWSWSWSKLFSTLIVILKKSFEKRNVIFHWYFTLPFAGYAPRYTDNPSFGRGRGQSRAQLNVKSNKCPECGKSFCSPAALQIHYRTHTSVICW